MNKMSIDGTHRRATLQQAVTIILGTFLYWLLTPEMDIATGAPAFANIASEIGLLSMLGVYATLLGVGLLAMRAPWHAGIR
jgi:hypothetical protein